MADTLETLYLNDNLGPTQFDADGEETILTTDANTRYVLKDMIVKDASSMGGNSYLELNGFRVADLTSNASGSLIVGPNSTLKLKTDKYPYTFVTREVAAIAGGKGFYEKKIEASDGSISNTVVAEGDPSYPSVPNSNIVVDFAFIDKGTNKFFHTAAHDNNSQQFLDYVRFGASPTSANLVARNYVAVGLSQDTSRGYVGLMSSSNNFYSYDLDANPTGLTSTTIASYSPYPTSSYPRSTVAYGYIWFMPSSGYSTEIYAMNIETGVTNHFNSMSSANMTGYSLNIGVTLDPVTDEFYLWRPDGLSTIYINKSNITKTEMDARTSNATVPHSQVNYLTLNKSFYNASMSSSVFSPQYDNTIGYKTSANEFITIDTAGNEVGGGFSTTSVEVAGHTLNTGSGYYTNKVTPTTNADLTTYGIVPPTFGVQLLGIKSENV